MATLLDFNPIFKEASKTVNFIIDEASKQNKEIFGKTWHEKYFTMGAMPRLTKDFKTILGKMDYTIAASTIDERASEPVRVTGGLSKVERSMFTHAHAYRHDHDMIRELMLMVRMAKTNSELEAARKYITDYLLDSAKEAVLGAKARFDIIILEALTNGGLYTFSQDNDPGSPFVGDTIDFRMPTANKGTVGGANVWNETNQATVDPLKEISDVMKQHPLLKFGKILIDQDMANYLMGCAKYKGYINNQLTYPNMPITLEDINRFQAAHGFPVFEVVNCIVGIQHDYTVKDYAPFKKGQLLFAPDGQLGTIETLVPDSDLGMVSDGVKYSKYGRYELREIRYGEKENTNYTEITKCSITGAPSISTINKMCVLDTTK